ncbi:hypothetical protein B1F79_05020 [Coxiella-like endosymbiont of Rhipicephalus sanguineus]|nr:hypothetical protein [Coxiella-like endosymbiont of Rhipicephalus sanguineus]
MLIFVLAVTFVFHTFWTYQVQEATNQMQHLTKNFSIIGGLFFIMSLEQGILASMALADVHYS